MKGERSSRARDSLIAARDSFALATESSLQVVSSSLDQPKRIFDPATQLPSITSLFDDIRQAFDPIDGSTLLYVHLTSNHIIEERYGWEASEAYIELIHGYLLRLAQDTRQNRKHCVVTRAFADDFVAILPYRSDDQHLATRLVDEMNRHVLAVDQDLAGLHQVYIGQVHIEPFSKIHPERLFYRGIQRAQSEAMDVGRQKLSAQVRVLDSCINHPDRFNIVYQPLVRICDHEIYAYEALTRCSHAALKNPHVLFNVAEQGNRIWALSRVLRKKTLTPPVDLPDGKLLFINLHPLDFGDPELLAPDPYVLRHAKHLVLEVTERAAIGDYKAFRSNVDRLREYGLRIAIDDLGSGYNALSAAAELDPDFIKFDMTLIRDIDKSSIRQNLVRNMVAFAIEIGCEVVAEGVETSEEFEVVKELGCHIVQGYFLARPEPPFITTINRCPPRKPIK